MNMRITGISSMATRQVLVDLLALYPHPPGVEVHIESVGGVQAAKRVQLGEAFDVVVLAADVIDSLVHAGRLQAGSRTDLVRSAMAVAAPSAGPKPDVASEAALLQAVLAAKTIAYSTGPSGTQLLVMFERWGVSDTLSGRLVQAPAGVPVAALLARGEAELGFQQLGELINVPGVDVLGTLPGTAAFVTTFSAGLGPHLSLAKAQALRDVLAFFNSAQAVPVKQRNGMDAA
jgi:molybdate transport system substrate-binding protein